MDEHESGNPLSRVLRPLTRVGSRAAGWAVGPLRSAVDAVLDSGELERLLTATLNDARVQAAFRRALETDGAAQLIDSLFESTLIDAFLERLLASEGLWSLVDEIAQSPAVTVAISQQGVNFAAQVGEQVRGRSGTADDWLERTARRLARRQTASPPPHPSASG